MQLTPAANNDQIKRELGRRIRDIRLAQNLTRSDFAEKSGLSASTIARMESGGNVSFDAVCDALRALGYLANLQLLLPEQDLKPTLLLERQAKRKRASRAGRNKSSHPWVWGEDQ